MTDSSTSRQSSFAEAGLRKTVEAHLAEIKKLYSEDQIPWIVGYSGGKDSTATLQLIWLAISQLQNDKRHKPIFVISTDTLVENPVVSAWVTKSLAVMNAAARERGLPIFVEQLKPKVSDTFWVNLIGRGYPAPRPKFRWCTERLKIKPVDEFINSVVKQNGEAIVILGTRKAESAVRAARINRSEMGRVRDHLSPHPELPNAYVYAPIVDWTNDDVWLFLMQVKNPWGYNNKDLLTMYQGASQDGECPLVVDTTTPSCGDSRFGCWVCTLVDKDKSMSAMVQNDQEKAWMEPMLSLRNDLDGHDHDKRDFRRMNGTVQLFRERDDPIPGPYTVTSREDWLRKLLTVQETVRRNPKTPELVRNIELISLEELQEIRRLWVVEKYEIEDTVPKIYLEVTGNPFEGAPIDSNQPFHHEEMQLLKESCDDDPLRFELVRELLEVERRYRGSARRSDLFKRLESAFKRSFYEDVDDASAVAKEKQQLRSIVESLRGDELDFPETRAAVGQVMDRTDRSIPKKAAQS
ncbi:DNA phosphorothioation system sulfurtransferase DndC [Bradyrhizobium sp. AUGA SZCCT0177]|uniref:DNA phosphorothioation system sulfurtransferase DndC n=1 Tax=Bradyrhizobium sp. AUGA SZCCT0177 TaxID=2807665 RepID=UPI0032DE3BA3